MKTPRLTKADLEYLIFVLNGTPLVEACETEYRDDSIRRDKMFQKVWTMWLHKALDTHVAGEPMPLPPSMAGDD